MLKHIMTLAFAGAFIFIGSQSAFAYEVKSGDTMNKISQSHKMSLKELASLNPQIKNLDLIYIGQNVNTNVNNSTVSKPAEAVSKPSNAEHDLLARLVRAEAESESYIGKVAVAEVVLNRVSSSQFPNSISSVIYQKGQFSPVANGAINRSANAESIKAVNEALNGSNYAKGALFFYNPKTATSRWLDSKPTITVIGNHTFK